MRRPIAIISMLMLLIVPITPMAGAIDTNELVFDNIWPVFGPGGETDAIVNPLLDEGDLNAEAFGGTVTEEPTASTTADGQPTYELSGYQCAGTNPNTGAEYDVSMSSPNPFFHSSLENGIFEATGSFFVDVDFTGNDADKVEEVHFGFAHTFPWPASSVLCNGAFPLPGAYYEFYRGDTTGTDGWEIPVNTLLVPDFAYGAILRAMDSQGNILASAFVYANVNNYANDENWQPGTPTSCDQDGDTGPLLCPYQDVTPPFPTVKGAEGHNAADTCPNGVLVSYGEPLDNPTTTDTPAFDTVTSHTFSETPDGQVQERDVDSVLLVQVDSEPWGPEYCVSKTAGSPIVVQAEDQLGNIGIREIHFAE